VKALLYHPPGDPRSEWKSEVVDESLHMSHNFSRVTLAGDERGSSVDSLLLGGKEGLLNVRRADGKWQRAALPISGDKPVGIGEVRVGSLVNGEQFIATVEPMHGNMLAVYVPAGAFGSAVALTRRVLTDKLVDGHAIACGDLLGGVPGVGATDQIALGWRGKPGAPGSTTGVAVWAPLDDKGEKWRETVIDPDGMACEDLQLADLDGDGKLDIVAAGRATKNVKIYFNQTAR
jgi:hypothetical protein